jgi:hypothetical protein
MNLLTSAIAFSLHLSCKKMIDNRVSNHYNSLCIWLMAEPFDALRIEEGEFTIKVFFDIPQGHWGSPECKDFCKILKNLEYFTWVEINNENSEEAVVFRKFKS